MQIFYDYEFLPEMRYKIRYHLYNLRNVKSTHGGVILFVKLQAIKETLRRWYFSLFLNYKNDTKLRKASHFIVPLLMAK